ncbi:helix-hairpin-helix domain-containing protein [Methanoculleus sp.]|uniref:helix-hairpin-helix domain-containing protein n=1 Tax=Methanoculleus sp. TaxID=90427 RepID=UPI002FC8E7DD
MRTADAQVTNADVAERLALMGRLLDITGADRYRIGAYERAARQVERLSLRVADLDEEELTRIPGIGARIAGQIRETVATGSFAELEELQAAIPESLIELLKISGVGPRTLHTLWKQLGILTLDDLEQAVKGRRLQNLPGFGAKKEETIARGIRQYRSRPDRMTRPAAEAVLTRLEAVLPDGQYTAAGSYRRGAATVGRVTVVTTADRAAFTDRVAAVDERRLEVRFTEPARCGTALLCATGSAGFLGRLSEAALTSGYGLTPGGLLENANGRVHTFGSEEEVFSFLGMTPIPPELREDRGEVELALRHALPDLVETRDVRGDFHSHTTRSDGRQTLEDVAEAGDARGYDYIAITDHSSRVSPEALREQRAAIERVNRRHDCELLAGSEVEIRSDGSLGYENRVLADLDLVIASVHSGHNQDQDVLTRRILTAMENEHVDIIGHPTGRLLDRRPPYAVDLSRVMAHAAETGTALEINASPHRLDLEDIYILHAKKRGVKLAAGTDAHCTGEFANMKNGVMLARRGWCAPGDLLNTLPLSGLLEWLS